MCFHTHTRIVPKFSTALLCFHRHSRFVPSILNSSFLLWSAARRGGLPLCSASVAPIPHCGIGIFLLSHGADLKVSATASARARSRENKAAARHGGPHSKALQLQSAPTHNSSLSFSLCQEKSSRFRSILNDMSNGKGQISKMMGSESPPTGAKRLPFEFCGYVLSEASTEEVEVAVKECILKASSGGGHIVSSSNAIHSSVKPEN